MLKEQAISLLTQVKEIILGSESWLDSVHQPIEEAFSMAIEAIKSTQHNTPNTLNALDTISRQAAIDALCKRCDLVSDNEPCTEECNDIKILELLPSAQQWTPVEDSPKRSGWYIVTKRFGNGETWIGTKWYSTAYGWNGDGILAWMKLPEAYKEGE